MGFTLLLAFALFSRASKTPVVSGDCASRIMRLHTRIRHYKPEIRRVWLPNLPNHRIRLKLLNARLSYFSPIRPGRSISSARLIDGPEAGVPDCPDIVGFELDGIFRDGEFKDEDTLMGVSILLDLLISNGVRSVLIGADAKTIDEARELLELDTGNPDLVQSLEAVVNPDNCVSGSVLRQGGDKEI
eukprot:1362411-Amorphochlora_amoeboformis.AAC.2